MAQILQNASCLKDLSLGLGHGLSNLGVFKQLSTSARQLPLRHVYTYQLRTQKKYLKTFLRLTKATLESLTLNSVLLEHGANMADFPSAEMALKNVTLTAGSRKSTGMLHTGTPARGTTLNTPNGCSVNEDRGLREGRDHVRAVRLQITADNQCTGRTVAVV